MGYGNKYNGFSEIITFHTTDVKIAIDTWMDTAYHRTILLEHRNESIGIGVVGRNITVNFGRNKTKPTVYPYNGQKDVGIGFYGFENPNPLTQFGISKSGYIISFSSENLGYYLDSLETVIIKDSSGKNVPHFYERAGAHYFFPKEELKYNETYTVSIDYADRNKTWSFTTKSKPEGETDPPKDPIEEPEVPTPFVPDPNRNPNEIAVYINGKLQAYDQPPMIKSGSTLVPLRGIFEALNTDITWDGATQTVYAKRGTTSIVLTIGNEFALVNGKKVILAQKAQIINGRTMVPLRFVSEALGSDVLWVGERKEIQINSN